MVNHSAWHGSRQAANAGEAQHPPLKVHDAWLHAGQKIRAGCSGCDAEIGLLVEDGVLIAAKNWKRRQYWVCAHARSSHEVIPNTLLVQLLLENLLLYNVSRLSHLLLHHVELQLLLLGRQQSLHLSHDCNRFTRGHIETCNYSVRRFCVSAVVFAAIIHIAAPLLTVLQKTTTMRGYERV